ncbi:MAG TPA: hypothetical protein DDW50_19775 [Firmicutes bacterium]|jgi:hypothetical protein|nr:hypothetical protein [Bacillota bacterium]
MKRIKYFLGFVLLVLLGTALTGCGGGGGGNNNNNNDNTNPVSSFSPSTAVLYALPNTEIDFNYTQTDAGYIYAWKVADSTGGPIIASGTNQNYSWTPTTTGDYTVTAKIIKGDGSSELANSSWTVHVTAAGAYKFFVVKTLNNTSVSGATADAVGTGFMGKYTVTSATDGSVSFSSLPAGSYFVKVSLPGSVTVYKYITVVANSTLSNFSDTDGKAFLQTWSNWNTMLSTTFDSSKSMIMGSVFDAGGNNKLGGATVSLSPSSGRAYYLVANEATGTMSLVTTSTDPDLGAYLVAGVSNNTYSFSAKCNGYNFGSIKFTIGEVAVYSIEIMAQ